MKRVLGSWTAIVLLSMALFGIASAGAQGATDDPAQVEAGQAVFEDNCAGCHGLDGAGTDRGRPLTDIATQEADRSVHVASVTDGIGNMPAFGERLDADQIDAAVSYVRLTFVSEAAAPVAEPDPVEELPNTGNGPFTGLMGIAGVAMVGMGGVFIQLARSSRRT